MNALKKCNTNQWAQNALQKLPFPMGDLNSNLIHNSLEPPNSPLHHSKQHLDCLSHCCEIHDHYQK